MSRRLRHGRGVVLVAAAMLVAGSCGGGSEVVDTAPRRTTSVETTSAPDTTRPPSTSAAITTDPPPTDPPTDPPTTEPATTEPTTTAEPEGDPYGVGAVEWPGVFGEAARLLDRLPPAYPGEERSPVVASANWFLVGNIPILANTETGGRVLVGYLAADSLERVVIAQPSASPLDQLWGFFIWGGAPDQCVDAEGSAGLASGGRFDEERLVEAANDGRFVWLGCTMRQNPDTGNEVEAPEDWAYGLGWTGPRMAYFVVARSADQRDELVAAMVAAAGSDLPVSDDQNPLFELAGPDVWWPGGSLVGCLYVEGEGVARYDPLEAAATMILEAGCDRVSLSPDGRSAVYDAINRDMLTLWVVDLDGTDRRMLIDPPVGDIPADSDSAASWSPTGEWIVFDRGGGELHLVRPDGTGLRSLGVGSDPTWSGDGSSVLANVMLSGAPGYRAIRIADGATVFEIADAESARWSPDGTRVAYVRDGELRLWSPTAGDLGTAPAGDSMGWCSMPVWSPDSRWIMVTSGMYGPVIVDTAAGAVHRLPSAGAIVEQHVVWVAG